MCAYVRVCMCVCKHQGHFTVTYHCSHWRKEWIHSWPQFLSPLPDEVSSELATTLGHSLGIFSPYSRCHSTSVLRKCVRHAWHKKLVLPYTYDLEFCPCGWSLFFLGIGILWSQMPVVFVPSLYGTVCKYHDLPRGGDSPEDPTTPYFRGNSHLGLLKITPPLVLSKFQTQRS